LNFFGIALNAVLLDVVHPQDISTQGAAKLLCRCGRNLNPPLRSAILLVPVDERFYCFKCDIEHCQHLVMMVYHINVTSAFITEVCYKGINIVSDLN
jgi:hypothetical protein